MRLALAGRGPFGAASSPRPAAADFRVTRMPVARWKHVPLALSFLVALLGAMTALASRDEYQVKAAFLLNFAKLVKWPARAQPAPGDPIVLGVKGGASVVESLSSRLEGAEVGDHAVAVRVVSEASDIPGCHIVFFASGHETSALLDAARSHAVLSVGESEGFAARGGVVNFISEGKKLRFEINPAAAGQAEIEISSRLLRLAKLVTDQ